jgi:hypothetical protein
MYNELVWRSFKKFNFEVQHTIVFTISIVNLKLSKGLPFSSKCMALIVQSK